MFDELIALAEKEITLERNQYLTVKGNVDNRIYYIVSGTLRVFVLDNFEEQNIRFGYQNNLIAVLDSFLTGKPSEFYVQAIKKSVLKVIEKSQFEDFIYQQHHEKPWINLLENLVLQQMEREVDLLSASPKERYLRVLKRSPQLFQEIPHRHIANYLRMTPETLSRLKKS